MAKPNRRNRNGEIGKLYSEVSKDERRNSHRRLKIRSMCLHTTSPGHPNLMPKEKNGVTVFICKDCQQNIDLRIVEEKDLQDAIDTITRVCDFIKIMSTGSDKDMRLIEEVISVTQVNLNAYLMEAYRAAKNNSNSKRSGRSGGGQRMGATVWGGEA